MPFDRIQFPEDSRFSHVPSRKFFILKRNIDGDYLTLTLHSRAVGTYQPEAGSVKITSNFACLSSLSSEDERHYAVKEILVLNAYRNISIGVLLMYLAVSEVWLNGGAYLYLMFPVFRAQGFYIQFGFHPAPEEVSERHLLYEDWDTKVPLEKKLKESRSYLFWRGSVAIASELLMKKLNGVFIFKNMA